MTRRVAARAAALALLAGLLAAPPAPAQPRPAPKDERGQFLEGTHAFRRILYDLSRRRLAPLTELDGRTDPARTLVVVVRDPAPLQQLSPRLGGLRNFVDRGGALLVATDRQTPPVLAGSFHVGVAGDLLTVPAGGADAYRGMKECPFARPTREGGPPLFQPGLTGAGRPEPPKVACNLPSHLDYRLGRELPTLADLPRGVVDGRGNRGPWAFAAGGELPNGGRVLIVADHDVFINEMMLQVDDGNLDFATRTAAWLLQGPSATRRDQVLYYEDGAVRTDFDIPLKQLPPPPLPPPGTLARELNDLLLGMEEDGTFRRVEEDDLANGAVEGLVEDVPLWERLSAAGKVWKFALLAATVVLGLYGFVRLGAFRHKPDARGPALAALLAKQAPAGALMAQRQEALLRAGNLWEAARELARHLFVAAGIDPAAAGAAPAVAVRGGWWRRWRARRALAALWRLAHAGPVHVSPRRFARLAAQVGELQAAVRAGKVRITR